MKPTRYEDLAELINNQPIACLEGTVTMLRKPYHGTGQYGAYTLHNGEITSGEFTHPILFAIEGGVDHLLNKTIHIECGMDKNNKPCDLLMTEKEYKGKMERAVKVGGRAKITVINGSGSTTPSQGSAPAQRTSSSPQGVSVQSNGNLDWEGILGTPFEYRLTDYRNCYEKTCREFGKDPEEMIGQLTGTDIKEITTGLVAGFKGKFGVYRDVIFEEPLSKEGAWEDFLYPAAGGKPERRLGDVPEADQLRYVTWAIGLDKSKIKEEQRPVYEAVMAMAEAKGWSTKNELEDQEDDIPF